MSRPHQFDLDELLAFWESGSYRTAPQVMEAAGIDPRHLRSVQKAINRYCGPRPQRVGAKKNDVLRRRVVVAMAREGIDPHRCSVCDRVTILPMYIREAAYDDQIASLRFVCRNCRRAGDV